MEPQKEDVIKEYVEKNFTETYLPSLMDFVRIPNLSPAFDENWNTNGHQMTAANHFKDFADSLEIQNYTSEIVKEPDRTPVLFLTIEPFNTDQDLTVLCYAHMDKQPWGEGWDEGKGPTLPVIENGKLFGRGSADDGIGFYSALLAIKACQDNERSHPRIYVFVESWEESPGDDLMFYMDQFIESKFKKTLDVIIPIDTGTPNNSTFWWTSSLRGIINFDLTVEAFKTGIHSGNSGIYADTFTVATDLISRLEDKNTYLMKEEFQVDIPEHRIKELRLVATQFSKMSDSFPELDGIRTIPTLICDEDNNEEIAYQQLINFWWKASLSIIGADGLPSSKAAGNWLRKATTLTISIRTPPTTDCEEMLERIKEVITKDVPFNYKATIDRVVTANGWDSKAIPDTLLDSLQTAVNDAYGTEPIFNGCGGCIPFAVNLGKKFPEASFLVIGPSLPDTNAHGPNENIDLESSKNMIVALSLFFSNIAEQK